MRFMKVSFLVATLVLLIIAGYCFQNEKTGKGNDTITQYELVKDWLKLPDSLILGNPTGIAVDTNQNIFSNRHYG